MYVTNTMRNVNNKLCMQITNLKLLTYKTYTTKKNPNTSYMFTKHIQTQWKKQEVNQNKRLTLKNFELEIWVSCSFSFTYTKARLEGNTKLKEPNHKDKGEQQVREIFGGNGTSA
jgi:hypothetical protein